MRLNLDWLPWRKRKTPEPPRKIGKHIYYPVDRGNSVYRYRGEATVNDDIDSFCAAMEKKGVKVIVTNKNLGEFINRHEQPIKG